MEGRALVTPFAEEIIAELPSLRRYACALTGSRRTGDEYIRVALIALAEEPWRIGAGADVKPQLFRLFHHAVDALHVRARGPSNDEPETGLHQSVQRAVLDLPLLTRKLLLLVTLERFRLERAAAILGVPIRDAQRRLVRARKALCGLARIPHDVPREPTQLSGAA